MDRQTDLQADLLVDSYIYTYYTQAVAIATCSANVLLLPLGRRKEKKKLQLVFLL